MLEDVLNQSSLHYKILDTNIPMSKHDAATMFPPREGSGKTNIIVCPIWSIYELDGLKHEPGDTGKNAIAALRWINNIGKNKEYSRGIPVGDNTYFTIWPHEDFKDIESSVKGLREDVDGKILRLGKKFLKEGKDVEIISNDFGLRILGNQYRVPCSPWFDITPIESIDELYKGWRVVPCEVGLIEQFRHNKRMQLTPAELGITDPNENEFFILQDHKNPDLLLESKYREGKLQHLASYYASKGPLIPKNYAQKCLMDALRDPNIKIVIAIGSAGTGKTLLELESALMQAAPQYFNRGHHAFQDLQENPYDGIVVWRSVIGIDPKERIGFIPGGEIEKMSPYYRPIKEQLEYLMSQDENMQDDEEVIFEKVFEFLPINDVRGRTIRDKQIIFEDAQNLDYKKMVTLMSRVGEGSKVAVNGDLSPEQLDAGISYSDNGLVILNESMKDHPISATIYFPPEFCVRSELAREATYLMQEFIKSRHKRIKL